MRLLPLLFLASLLPARALEVKIESTDADLAAMPHYHPTLSEIWTYPAEEIADLLKK